MVGSSTFYFLLRLEAMVLPLLATTPRPAPTAEAPALRRQCAALDPNAAAPSSPPGTFSVTHFDADSKPTAISLPFLEIAS